MISITRIYRVFNADGLRLLYRHRELLVNLVLRDLKGRFTGSMLGFYWFILHPLLLLSVYVIVFALVFRVRLGGESGGWDYALFAIIGLVPWLAFAEATSRANTALTSQANLVQKVIFPIELLPAQVVLTSFITQLISTALVLLLIGATLRHLGWTVVFLPFVLLVQVLFSLGIAWLLASLNVFFRDTKEVVQALLTIGLFVTPILYSEDMVPPLLALPIAFNPLTHLIYMYRDVLFYGKILHGWSFLIFTAMAIFVFLLGYSFFVKTKSVFGDLL